MQRPFFHIRSHSQVPHGHKLSGDYHPTHHSEWEVAKWRQVGGMSSGKGLGQGRTWGHEMTSGFEEPQHGLDHEVWEVWWRVSGEAVMGWGDKSDTQELNIFCITMVQIKMLKSCTGVRDEQDLCERENPQTWGRIKHSGRKTERKIAGFLLWEWTMWWPH